MTCHQERLDIWRGASSSPSATDPEGGPLTGSRVDHVERHADLDRHRGRVRVRAISLVVAIGLVVAACSSDDTDRDDTASEEESTTTTAAPVEQRGEGVASPEVTGPVTGGADGKPFLAADPALLEEYGYVEEEYVLEGEAAAYESDAPLAADGRWTVTPGETAPYRTRIIVRYPDDPEAFDGTVWVEWYNVTGGIDNDPRLRPGPSGDAGRRLGLRRRVGPGGRHRRAAARPSKSRARPRSPA